MPAVSREGPLQWPLFDADGAVSDVPGLMIVMTFADCVPVLLWDPNRGACGFVHAGWRGTALRVASSAVNAMVAEFDVDPRNIRAVIGPSIGPCCYEVGDDVWNTMAHAYPTLEARPDHDRLDLWKSNRQDLLSAGLADTHIETSGTCTSCHTDRFFSHRAEGGQTGRFGACIGLRWVGGRMREEVDDPRG